MIDSIIISLNTEQAPFRNIDAYLLKENKDWQAWQNGQFKEQYDFIKTNHEFDKCDLHTTKDGSKKGYPYFFNKYKYYGVQFQSYFTGEILCIMYPHKVIYPHDNVTLYSPDEQDLFVNGINSIMDEMNLPHIESKLWQTKRVDYTVNIPCAYTRLYLDLMNRSRSMAFQDRKQFDGNSCYLTSKSVNVNIYSKENQLAKKTDLQMIDRNITQDDIVNATDILRVEVQCKAEKVKTLQKKHGWKDRNIMHYLNPNIAIEVLKGCAKQFYTGDYWSADKGKGYNVFNKVDEASGIQTQTKDHMKQILSLLATDRELTLDEVRQILKDEKHISDTQWYTIIKRFNAINVNPVPIPTRQCKEYHVRTLDSLSYLIDEYIELGYL